jgi:hypothetical protein
MRISVYGPHTQAVGRHILRAFGKIHGMIKPTFSWAKNGQILSFSGVSKQGKSTDRVKIDIPPNRNLSDPVQQGSPATLPMQYFCSSFSRNQRETYFP